MDCGLLRKTRSSIIAVVVWVRGCTSVYQHASGKFHKSRSAGRRETREKCVHYRLDTTCTGPACSTGDFTSSTFKTFIKKNIKKHTSSVKYLIINFSKLNITTYIHVYPGIQVVYLYPLSLPWYHQYFKVPVPCLILHRLNRLPYLLPSASFSASSKSLGGKSLHTGNPQVGSGMGMGTVPNTWPGNMPRQPSWLLGTE